MHLISIGNDLRDIKELLMSIPLNEREQESALTRKILEGSSKNFHSSSSLSIPSTARQPTRATSRRNSLKRLPPKEFYPDSLDDVERDCYSSDHVLASNILVLSLQRQVQELQEQQLQKRHQEQELLLRENEMLKAQGQKLQQQIDDLKKKEQDKLENDIQALQNQVNRNYEIIRKSNEDFLDVIKKQRIEDVEIMGKMQSPILEIVHKLLDIRSNVSTRFHQC